VSPHDAKLDQAERFQLCQPGPLQALFERMGLQAVTVHAIQIRTVFENFDDYWTRSSARLARRRRIWRRWMRMCVSESACVSSRVWHRRPPDASS